MAAQGKWRARGERDARARQAGWSRPPGDPEARFAAGRVLRHSKGLALRLVSSGGDPRPMGVNPAKKSDPPGGPLQFLLRVHAHGWSRPAALHPRCAKNRPPHFSLRGARQGRHGMPHGEIEHKREFSEEPLALGPCLRHRDSSQNFFYVLRPATLSPSGHITPGDSSNPSPCAIQGLG